MEVKLGMLIAFRKAVNILHGWFCVGKAIMVALQAACPKYYNWVELSHIIPFLKTVTDNDFP